MKKSCPRCNGTGIEPNAHKIGFTLRLRRAQLGLRQVQVAKSLGVSPTLLNLMENGKRRWQPSLLNKIEQLFRRTKKPK